MVKFGLAIKFKMDYILLKLTIPSFHNSAKASLRAHYSMIEAKIYASKISCIFI